jgi:hypothetical protein
MKNQLCAYAINDPTIFEEMVTLSGLVTPNTIIRLSPNQIYRLQNSIDCMASGAISAFVSKYVNLSGDCYVTLTSDKNGNEVFALDIVRPDDPSKTGCYVMDQEPVYIVKHPSGWESVAEAQKVFHLSCDGRTFDLSAYNALSGYLDNRRDVPIFYSDISSFDPGIVNAISKGVSLI